MEQQVKDSPAAACVTQIKELNQDSKQNLRLNQDSKHNPTLNQDSKQNLTLAVSTGD